MLGQEGNRGLRMKKTNNFRLIQMVIQELTTVHSTGRKNQRNCSKSTFQLRRMLTCFVEHCLIREQKSFSFFFSDFYGLLTLIIKLVHLIRKFIVFKLNEIFGFSVKSCWRLMRTRIYPKIMNVLASSILKEGKHLIMDIDCNLKRVYSFCPII